MHMAQALCRTVLASLSLAAAACSSAATSSFVAPADPEVTVSSFMNAVRANDLRAMGQLWGTASGPAVGRMDADQLDMRLAVMQRYLTHETFQLVPPPSTASEREGRRMYQVELTRLGCLIQVPIELVRVKSGWLVTNVDLTRAGAPGRPCTGISSRGTSLAVGALIIP